MTGPENRFTESFTQKLQATRAALNHLLRGKEFQFYYLAIFAQTRRMNSVGSIHLMNGGLTSV